MMLRCAVARYSRPLGTTVVAALLCAPLFTSSLVHAQQAAPVASAPITAPTTTPIATPTPAAPPVAAPPDEPAVAASPAAAVTPSTTTMAPAIAPMRTAPQVAMPASNGPGAAGLLQTIFALLLVLGLLIGLAWLLKRYGPKTGAGTANLRVVGALNIGGRERIMVVEVGDQWIVVGAAPGRVNALHTMPRQEGELSASATGGGVPATRFADWLKNTMDKRNAT